MLRLALTYIVIVKNDMLQWVMDEAAQRTGTDEEVVTRIMLINFASVHTVALVRRCDVLADRWHSDLSFFDFLRLSTMLYFIWLMSLPSFKRSSSRQRRS